jgi:hypothetical protein
MLQANAPGGGTVRAPGIARAGRGRATGPHGAGFHHAGRQPARGARPELPARLLAAGRHARLGLRVPQRLELVRRRRGIQPWVGLRAIPGGPVRRPAGPDHELRPTRRGPGGDVLGRAVLGSALSRSPLVPPASTARIPPAASPADASAAAATSSGAAIREAAFRGAPARTTAARTSAVRRPAATHCPASLTLSDGGSSGSPGVNPGVPSRALHGRGPRDKSDR